MNRVSGIGPWITEIGNKMKAIMTTHFEERMKLRGIRLEDIMFAIENGNISNLTDKKKNVKCKRVRWGKYEIIIEPREDCWKLITIYGR